MTGAQQRHLPDDIQKRDDRAPKVLAGTTQDARPDDLGHEGVTSGVKRNTTGQGERQDRE